MNNITKDIKEYDELINEISNYNVIDFIENISVLMLFPKNQSKAIIFQTMINTALTIPINSINKPNKMNITTFKKIVKKFEYSFISKMIDPPDFPFVLPVLYFNNPYVFMGNNSMSPIYLGNLLKVFEFKKKKIEYQKYCYIRNKINGLLTLSNNIFKKLNLKFDLMKSYSIEEEIYVPNSKILFEYKKLIAFDYKYIEELFESDITEFLIDLGSINKDSIVEVANPTFIYKPFVKYNDKYILLDVTCILPLIFRFVVKETFNLPEVNLIEEYNELNSIQINSFFYMLGCEEILYKDLKLLKEKDYEEKIYLIGNDCIILNIQLFDYGQNIDFDKPSEIIKFERENNFISKRIKNISNIIKKHDIDENKIYIIISPYTLGRDFIYPVSSEYKNNIMIFSLYELDSIAKNECFNKYFIKEYIDSRKKLLYYEKNLFTELNLLAFFVKNDYSFYCADEVDTKEVLISYSGEYSSDYILKSYISHSKKLCNYYKDNLLIEVEKVDENIYFSSNLLLKNILNKVIIDNDSTLWILCNMEDSFNYSLFMWVSDLIAYWINQLIPLSKIKYNVTIELFFDNTLIQGIEKKIIYDDINNIINYIIDDSTLKIYIDNKFCNYFNNDTNENEKKFIMYIVRLLSEKYSINYEIDKIEEIFKNTYRKKTINITSDAEPYMVPTNSTITYRVSRAYENLILDDIGLYLKNVQNLNYGIIKDNKIFNDIVSFLYNRLLSHLKKYNKKDLVCYLYTLYEQNLANLMIRQSYYANDIACYPNHRKEIEENINEMNKFSVSVRFMIELVSSFNNSDNNKVSVCDLQYDIALASQIIEFAYSGDLYHYNLIDSDIELLYSNRVGFKKDTLLKINCILKKTMLYKNSIKGIENYKRLNNYLPNDNVADDLFEIAFYDEFGYSYNDFSEVVSTILYLFNDKYDKLLEFDINLLSKNIQFKIDDDIIEKILNSISLEERDDFLKPPNNYRLEDVYPWRFNRSLSLLRQPLIKNNNKYIVGYRNLAHSVHYLLNLINSGRFKAFSKKMKEYVSKKNNNKGRVFNDQVYNYIKDFDKLLVFKNVKKVNGKKLRDENNNDLGDIDILYISITKKIIGIIETKNFNYSKNYYEIYNEYHEMFDLDNKKCFYIKHKRRVEWVKNHLDDIIKEYDLPRIKWKFKEMFIVNNFIVSKKTYNVNVNIFTLNELFEKNLY